MLLKGIHIGAGEKMNSSEQKFEKFKTGFCKSGNLVNDELAVIFWGT